jgi:hypothetical protein
MGVWSSSLVCNYCKYHATVLHVLFNGIGISYDACFGVGVHGSLLPSRQDHFTIPERMLSASLGMRIPRI